MKRVNLRLYFDVSKKTPDKDIVEWVEFITGQIGSISNSNPLVKYEANDLDSTLKATFRLEINGNKIK